MIPQINDNSRHKVIESAHDYKWICTLHCLKQFSVIEMILNDRETEIKMAELLPFKVYIFIFVDAIFQNCTDSLIHI